MIEFFVPMKKIPTVTHQQKKVTIRNGKPHFYEPEELKETRALFVERLAPYKPKKPLQGAVRLIIKWCFPMTKKSTPGEFKITKPDVDNSVKLIQDCMTFLEFWRDDAQVASLIAEKFFAPQGGIYIKVEEVE